MPVVMSYRTALPSSNRKTQREEAVPLSDAESIRVVTALMGTAKAFSLTSVSISTVADIPGRKGVQLLSRPATMSA